MISGYYFIPSGWPARRKWFFDTRAHLEKVARFTGKHYDADVGLYYYNARWYDQQTGRFSTEDPIRDGQNWYVLYFIIEEYP
jgi:RHS repeat-associated protein